MNMRHVGVVLRKEIRDTMRDRRTLITSLLLPMLLMPLLFLLMGGSMSGMEQSIDKKLSIGLTQAAAQGQVRGQIEALLKDVGEVDWHMGDAQALLKDEKVSVVLDVQEGAEQAIAQGKPIQITIICDESKLVSSAAANRIATAIGKSADVVMREKLSAQGIQLEDMLPARTDVVDVRALYPQEGGKAGSDNFFISMMLPMMLTIFLWSGGSGSACDVIAGEKERFTLEPLLATTADRMSILTGKVLSVGFYMLLSLITSMIGFGVSFVIAPQFADSFGGSMAINLPVASLVLVVLGIVLMGFTFVAIQIAVSALARSMKQAQQWLGLLLLPVMVPAFATIFMQAGDVSMGMMFVPVLNAIGMMKLALGGVLNYGMMGAAVVSSLVYLVVALWLTSRLFRRESVLFRA